MKLLSVFLFGGLTFAQSSYIVGTTSVEDPDNCPCENDPPSTTTSFIPPPTTTTSYIPPPTTTTTSSRPPTTTTTSYIPPPTTTTTTSYIPPPTTSTTSYRPPTTTTTSMIITTRSSTTTSRSTTVSTSSGMCPIQMPCPECEECGECNCPAPNCPPQVICPSQMVCPPPVCPSQMACPTQTACPTQLACPSQMPCPTQICPPRATVTDTSISVSISTSVSISRTTIYLQPGVVTVDGPTSTLTIAQTVTVQGPISTVTSPVFVTVPGPTSTVTSPVLITVTGTLTSTTTVPAVIVTVTGPGATVVQPVTATATAIATSLITITGTGVTTCTSRIVNPTYTPHEPLPTSYLWGCPPGKICNPPKIGCNFEQNPPRDTYFCRPEECVPVVELPSYEALDAANKFNNGSCAWYTPVDDYFNLNPLYIGLDFGIFKVNGAAACTSSSACPTATAAPASWAGWEAPKPTAHQTWAAPPPKVTKKATLAERGLMRRQLNAAPECYEPCNYAELVYQSYGRVPAMCGPFNDAYQRAQDCVDAQTGTVEQIFTALNDPLEFCPPPAPAKRFAWGRRA